MRKFKSLPCEQKRGQSLVEMGIFMMIFLLLLAGAINFGVAFFDYVSVRDAAQEGALYGAVNPLGNIDARVRASSSAPVDLTDSTAVKVQINFDGTAEAYCPGHPVTVNVLYNSPIIMPIAGIFSNNIPLKGSATSIILASTYPGCP